jgi:hypothetical protein
VKVIPFQARHNDLAAHGVDQPLADGEPRPVPNLRVVDWSAWLNASKKRRCATADADAGVGHGDLQASVHLAPPSKDDGDTALP